MADFGAFLSNIALGAGRNMQYSQQQEERQAALDDQKSQTATRLENSKLLRDEFIQRSGIAERQAQAAAQKKAGIENVFNTIKTRDTVENSPVQTAEADAEMWGRRADALLKSGNIAEGEMALKQAEVKTKDAERHQKIVKDRKADRVDTLGTTAEGVLRAIQSGGLTPELMKEYDVARTANGLPPFEGQEYDKSGAPIPGTGYDITSKRGQAELTMQSVASDKARKIRESESKMANDDARIKETREYHQQLADGAKERTRLKAEQQEAKDKKEASGEKLTATEKNSIFGIVGAVGEGLRGVRIISALPVGTTAGAFTGLNSDGIINSLSKVGTNTVTPSSMQIYHTAAAGLGMEIGRAVTLGGGRSATDSQNKKFQEMVEAIPGDTEYTAMFKLVNGVDILRNRIESLPDSNHPKLRIKVKEYEELMAKYPSPEAIIAQASKDPNQKNKMLSIQNSMSTALAALMDGDTPKPSPGGLSGEQQSAIDQYRKKK